MAPPGNDDGAGIENIEEILASDISSGNSQGIEAMKDAKVKEQYGNIIENKGSCLDNRARSGNRTENKASYAERVGMSLKRKGVTGSVELHATSKWPSFPPASDDERSLGGSRRTY
jgi:hypothetical protein